jgi:hypothetical protein
MKKSERLPVLGQLYKTLEPEWQFWLRYRSVDYCIPTEFVVYEPQIVTPKTARSYDTELYLLDSKLVRYEELRLQPTFKGTYREVSITLVEVWVNRGSDGHVAWDQIGWRFVPDYCMKFLSHDERLKLPEPMSLQYWEYGVR